MADIRNDLINELVSAYDCSRNLAVKEVSNYLKENPASEDTSHDEFIEIVDHIYDTSKYWD